MKHAKPAFVFSSALAIALLAAQASAADDPVLNRAYQDHIAYMATLAMPVLIGKCGADDAGYMQKAAPLYFRYVNARQDQIERGRLLTLAELEPNQTLSAYREKLLATRMGKLDTGTAEEKAMMCERALGVLNGEPLPGEWPVRATKDQP